jgi:hypothetical protein
MNLGAALLRFQYVNSQSETPFRFPESFRIDVAKAALQYSDQFFRAAISSRSDQKNKKPEE